VASATDWRPSPRLKANRIAGAALDVFDQEPTLQDNPLLTLPNFMPGGRIANHRRGFRNRAGSGRRDP
jgi:phosphoglycerate dehydrogenase-like enzyme